LTENFAPFEGTREYIDGAKFSQPMLDRYELKHS